MGGGDQLMERQPHITKERKEEFLRVLRSCGVVRRAAAVASPGLTNAHRSFYRLRERDEEFRAQWDEALEAAIGDAENALWQMGVEGVTERERIDADGNVRDRTVRRDFRALQLFLAARDPKYRQQRVVESSVDAKVSGKVDVKSVTRDLSGLSTNELEQLERILSKGSTE
jgi:hypothetical protein